MLSALDTQQTLFLPKEHSLNKRQYVQYDENYGFSKR